MKAAYKAAYDRAMAQAMAEATAAAERQAAADARQAANLRAGAFSSPAVDLTKTEATRPQQPNAEALAVSSQMQKLMEQMTALSSAVTDLQRGQKRYR